MHYACLNLLLLRCRQSACHYASFLRLAGTDLSCAFCTSYFSIVPKGTIEDLKIFIRGETSKCELSFNSIGKYKRTCWGFQQECRYKIFGNPMGIKEMDDPNFMVALEKQKEYVRRILDDSYVPGYQALYVDLDEAAINEMELVFGPRMNASDKILLKTFLKSKGLENNYRDSSLRIQ